MVYIKINKELAKIKFPRIVYYNDYYYIYGINSIIDNETNLNKFIIECFKYDTNMNLKKKINIRHKFESSTLIWQIMEEKNYFIFLIEQKSINKTKHSCKYYKYYIKKKNLENFEILKIEKLELENHLISKLYYNYILSSKIEVDKERPDYYWGKYLFSFIKNGNSYNPNFDKIVNYKTDKGHLLHYIEKKQDIYFIIFSIRHKHENKNEYYYNIYSSKSKDLINFYETKKVEIQNNISISNWYCYLEIFIKNDEYFILLNQDDFGKNKNTLIGNIFF
uniref:Uncharacterized protein n=1 Tax=viral metagenome TaxID=1070528 RepID=A0A6C0LZ83_9ZZZZ